MIREQVANYTKALDTGDLALAARVWWDTKDVSSITPMGHPHGWDEVKGMYQFFADNFTVNGGGVTATFPIVNDVARNVGFNAVNYSSSLTNP